MPRIRFFIPCLTALLAAGCASGPDFQRPDAPAAMGAAFARGAGAAPSSSPTLAPWWRGLDDARLEQLIVRALAANPSLQAIQARMGQARAASDGARAAQAPLLGASASAGRARIPAVLTGGPAQSEPVFVAGFDALWEIDLFGGRRRGAEAAQAQFEASQAALDGARLGLSAEVARQYLLLGSAQQRLALAQRSLAAQQTITDLSGELLRAGRSGRPEFEHSARSLEAARVALEWLRAELDARQDALAVLLGEVPGALDAELAAVAELPLPPAEVAVGDPAAMLARRPDIRQAEQSLRAANAGIGVAEAARMPHVSLVGLIGVGGLARGKLASGDNLFSLAGPSLQWNAADFGRGRAAVEQAVAGRDEARFAYRATVLAALQDAENALGGYRQARHGFAAQSRSASSARSSALLAGQARQAGRISALAALAAEREQLAAEDAAVQARATLTIGYVMLQKALGLGLEESAPAHG